MIICERMFDFTPVFPYQVELLETSAETNGNYVKMQVKLNNGAIGAPLHIHKYQEETYTVLRGLLEVYYKNQWHLLPPGKSIVVAKGEPHSFRAVKHFDVVFENAYFPALQQENYIAALHALVIEDKIKKPQHFLSLVYLSMLWIKYKQDIVPLQPPYFLIRLLAGFGKMAGYTIDKRACAEKYTF